MAAGKKVHTKSPERLFLLDGMALAYRAYFSFMGRPLVNSKGENTGAIFGFVNTLMKILQDDRPDHLAVVFDTKEPTFRHKMYEPYKATRQKIPEDLAAQLGRLKEVVQAFNVPTIEVPGYEADDIMGTLARRAEREGMETYLVTSDKDFMQLISPSIKMYKPGKRGDDWEIVDEKSVLKKFGVAPDRVTDVLAIIGDSSDNVPGVHGIGEKTAIPLVQQYGSLEEILKNKDEIPQKGIRQKLEEYRDTAILSKKLVTINIKVPLSIDLHHLSAKPKNIGKLRQIYQDLEFKSLLAKLMPDDRVSTPTPPPAEYASIESDPHTYHLVTSENELARLAALLKKADCISFDTETTGKDPLRAELVGLSFAVTPHEAWYVPVADDRPGTTGADSAPDDLFSSEGTRRTSKRTKTQPDGETGKHSPSGDGLPLDKVLQLIAPVLTSRSVQKVGQNIKYDMLVMARHGIMPEGIAFDTMLANYLLRPDAQHNLDALAREHLNYSMISYDELTGTGKNRKDLRDIPVGRVADYSAQDADITLRLASLLRGRLKEENLFTLFTEVELPLITVLAGMELHGVALDVGYLHDLSKELERMLDALTGEIYSIAGEKFNINSTQQLSKILFDRLKLPAVRKTKTGYSTDVGVLETLRHEHPIVETLLAYRQVQKLKSTYVDALPDLVDPRTHRVHTSYNQTVATTGRLSSSDPNLQNIPIRTEIGQRIRRAFIPSSPDFLILSADYSQIELRVMAHLSGDEGLTSAFIEGEDIHTTTAATVFNVARSGVTKDMRRKAKEVNFGIMYGIGPFGLSSRLDITQTEAKDIITKYFARFPKVQQYISDTIATARRTGFVSTLLGRRRYFPDIKSNNFSVRSNAERQAINMPIQGTAADMIKIAMIHIQQSLPAKKIKATMILQVHDELVFEVSKKDTAAAEQFVSEKMKNALPLSVPIGVDVGIGKNWLEAH